jgi:hypothetical protein
VCRGANRRARLEGADEPLRRVCGRSAATVRAGDAGSGETTPRDYLGAIIGDLQSRRGVITGSDMHASVHEVSALVPLANMVSYVNTVRSLSQGRAIFTMQFGHYAALPQALEAKVVAQCA